jgi:hypothetical protein
MLDAQMHYPVFTHGSRAVASQSDPISRRGIRRIFRLGDARATRSTTRSR